MALVRRPPERQRKEGSRAQRDPYVGRAFSLVTFSLRAQRESDSSDRTKPVTKRSYPNAALGFATLNPTYGEQASGRKGSHANTRSTASSNTLGEANCISRVAISTATCTLLPRVMRSPLAASRIR